uniref:C-X-C chemokine receptor type 4-B-like isoform X2 n=1 Tax=Geotrypetes seraphini TaxID=260995 RepID=A0A6P8R067_GEOSA|nr:C-X-C chemokine receptor type 4-B-like isoform X2 [Geotrypetes seraphini]
MDKVSEFMIDVPFDNSTDDLGSGDFDDLTEPCYTQNTSFNQIFLPVVFSIIFVIGIVGNGLVVVVMGYQKKSRTMTDKYRLHLSVADLLFVFTLPFWSAEAAQGWHFKIPNVLCKGINSVYTINLYSIVLILAFISLDRYLAIVHATNSQGTRKLLAEKIIYAGVWLPAVLLSVPDLIFSTVSEVEGVYGCNHIYPGDQVKWETSFRFLHIMVGFIFPGLIILTCYCIIISKLSHSKGHQKRRALKTTVILILAFFACLLPYYICLGMEAFILLGTVKSDCILQDNVDKWISITEAVAFFHCCLNPILYAFLGAKFKMSAHNAFSSVSRGSSLKILSKKRGGLSSVSTESESSSFHSS